jgi:hypothetical protein
MNEELKRLSLMTMPQALKYRAETQGEGLALREKDFGVWRRTSWREYFVKARRFAIGLYALGFRAGDRLAVASDDTPEWFYADLAAQMIGGACLGIYPTNPWPELQYILRHSRAKIVVCGDQEQTDKVLDAQRNEGGLPDLTTVICVDMKGMRHYKQDGLMSFAAVMALGESKETEFGATVDAALAAGMPDDTAIIVYTSGTTGMPKGAMLSHRNMMHTSVQVISVLKLNAQNYSVRLKYIHDHSEPKNPVYGIIRQDDDFGQEVEAGYERAVKEFGVKDGIRLRFKKGTSNFAAEMAQMKQAGVNVLANGGIFAGAANILSEARKLDMDIQSADVWSEGIPASAKLAAPAGYDYLVGDYVALTGPAVEKFLAMAKQFTTTEELAGVSRYTFVTYVGLKSLAHAMQECGKELTRACTIEKLRQTKNLDTGGLSAPVSFDNPQQLAGTEVAVYQLNAKELKFHELVGFKKY